MTVRKLVDSLGGSALVARKLKVAKPTVYAMMQKDAISEAMGWRFLHVWPHLDRAELGLPDLDSAA
jgi:hypothetical protein